MMKRAGQLLALAIALLTAGAARGSWSSNWPSWNYPRSGRHHARECYSAAVERASTSGVDLPTGPAWWRSQRTNLENLKEWVRDNVDEFVFTNDIYDSTGFTNYLNSTFPYDTNFTSTLFPRWTVVTLCSNANLPTNFFDYTPWRCLNGAGPFTNDTSVGHPYGWTNATTESGGTFFPAGRSTWYTTDYGWQGFKSAIVRLDDTEWTTHPFTTNIDERGSSGGGAVSYVSWSDAKANETANPHTWPTNYAPINRPIYKYSRGQYDEHDPTPWWIARKSRHNSQDFWIADLPALTNGFDRTVEVFFPFYGQRDGINNGTRESWDWDFYTNSTSTNLVAFDAQGSDFLEGWNQVHVESGTNNVDYDPQPRGAGNLYSHRGPAVTNASVGFFWTMGDSDSVTWCADPTGLTEKYPGEWRRTWLGYGTKRRANHLSPAQTAAGNGLFIWDEDRAIFVRWSYSYD